MTFENALKILRAISKAGCIGVYENWCESHDSCKKCKEEALENLKSAHDEEINHARKVEYHRGYNDGRNFVNPDEWQLEQQRHYVARRLREYRDAPPVQTLEIVNGDAIEVDAYTFGGILSAVMYPVTEFPTSMFIDKLIYLLVGKMPEGTDSAIYGNWEKAEVSAKTTASTLQKSPDLTSCHELGKLLKKTLGEAKCVHDRLKDQSKSHADLKDENRRLKGECRMYRTMLNDAAEAYKKERDRSSENCEQVRDGWREIVRHCLDDAVMYCDLLNDAKEDYVSLMDERDKLREQCAEYKHAITGYKERAESFEKSERLRRELEAERDKLRRNVERFMLYGSKDYIELPTDKNGKHVHMGDVMSWEGTGRPFKVGQITLCANGIAYIGDGIAYIGDEAHPDYCMFRVAHCRHSTGADPIEETFREYELGNLTSSEAIEKIREATNVG